MKVTIERAALLKALAHVHRIVERRNTIPILSNVLLEATEGRLAMKSTDLDLEATESAVADVVQTGATTVAAHVIHDIVRKLPEGAQVGLAISAETGQLELRSGRSRFLLQSLPASDFPDLTTGEFPHRFSLPAIELKRLIDNAQFAISTEETRYYLNGIYFHTVAVGGTTMLRAVATDGHRLARGGDARRDRAAKSGQRNPEAARGHVARGGDRDFHRQGAVPVRRRQTDHQADRRHFPRLQSRDSVA
jgi:DNA polymerase-3 subunit beta